MRHIYGILKVSAMCTESKKRVCFCGSIPDSISCPKLKHIKREGLHLEKDKAKMILKEEEYGIVDWNHLTQYRS
jgi:hypothetical protein